MDEGGEEPEQPLVLSASSAYLGGVGEISGTYKSESGSYDSNIRALVYIDGSYAGDADLLPRTPPGPGEEDPGQSFTYDIPARNLGGYEVEFIIINGDETASTVLQLEVKASPLTDDTVFFESLYNKLFNRLPKTLEYEEYLNLLENDNLSREQLISKLRDSEEFISITQLLLAHKTVSGNWAGSTKYLVDTIQEIPPEIVEITRPDDGGDNGSATTISMNEVIEGRIDVPLDRDYFKIQSLGPGRNGVLSISILDGHPGADLQAAYENYLDRMIATSPSGEVTLFPQTPATMAGYGINEMHTHVYDLRSFQGDSSWYFYINVWGNPIETGPYTLVVSNDEVGSDNDGDSIEVEFFRTINIPKFVENYSSLFSYTNQFGAIGTHNPEEFFTRLFRNKYEQDPSPVQIARGLELLNNPSDLNDTGTGFSQLDFLSKFCIGQCDPQCGPIQLHP